MKLSNRQADPAKPEIDDTDHSGSGIILTGQEDGLLKDFLNITEGDVKAENLHSEFEDGMEVLNFGVGGNAHTWRIPHESDWIDDQFIFNVFELVKSNSPGQMIIDRMDDFVTVIYVPQPNQTFSPTTLTTCSPSVSAEIARWLSMSVTVSSARTSASLRASS